MAKGGLQGNPLLERSRPSEERICGKQEETLSEVREASQNQRSTARRSEVTVQRQAQEELALSEGKKPSPALQPQGIPRQADSVKGVAPAIRQSRVSCYVIPQRKDSFPAVSGEMARKVGSRRRKAAAGSRSRPFQHSGGPKKHLFPPERPACASATGNAPRLIGQGTPKATQGGLNGCGAYPWARPWYHLRMLRGVVQVSCPLPWKPMGAVGCESRSAMMRVRGMDGEE